jgi:hypothetical protein
MAASVETEIGPNDFRISHMGPDGDVNYSAFAPAVAYNSVDDEFLVVWTGDDDTNDEFEIYGQRIDATTGAGIGGAFRISRMGPDGNTNYFGARCDVAYNPTDNEYLVVWDGDDDTATLVDDDFEIFGQRIDATGAEVGPDDFRISHLGTDGDTASGWASSPAVAYNLTNHEYLVVWYGCDDTAPLVPGEYEIFGQRVGVAGDLVGAPSFRISDVGPDGSSQFRAGFPDVAYNSNDNEYLVVWIADDSIGNENDIYGQRIDGVTGAELGTNDFRISDMGSDGDTNYFGVYPAVAYDPNNNRYLVVWYGDDNVDPLVDQEWEVFGQLLDGFTGEEIGANDFRISDMGSDGDVSRRAYLPDLAFDSLSGEYLVVWCGDDAVDNENEVYGQRVTADGAQIGTNDFRISDMGPDGDTGYGVDNVRVAFRVGTNFALIVWDGDDNTPPLVLDEKEVFGQLFISATATTTTITGHTPDASVVGQAVTFSYQINGGGLGAPTGDVTVSDGHDSCTATVAAGECDIVFNSPGDKNVTATYSGDAKSAPSASAAVAHTVTRARATVTITSVSPSPSVSGQAVQIQYSVTSEFGSPAGDVTISDGTQTYTGTVAAGECTMVYTTAGERELTASYAGDDNFQEAASAALAHTVVKGDTAITLAASGEGDLVTFTTSVSAAAPAAGIPTGTLTFTFGDRTVGAVNLDPSGRAMLAAVALIPGSYSLGAAYAGDVNFNASNTTISHEIAGPDDGDDADRPGVDEGLPPGCGPGCGNGAGFPTAVGVLGLVWARRRFRRP